MSKHTRHGLLAGCTLGAMLAAGTAHAQQQTPTPPPAEPVPGLAASAGQDNSGVAPTPSRDPAPDADVVVVGSQIRGARTTAALPVTVVDANAIAATGAVSGDELLRSIPQNGDVTFNPSNNAQTSNSARGDVNSINLRNLGVGNTLVLLNGRRLVQHPTSQADPGTNVPVLGYNANALPVAGIERLEILRDGAAAIYGADAVAGVVNTVTQSDYNGLSLNARYGFAQGTSREESEVTGYVGHNFAEGRGNVSLFGDYTVRSPQYNADEPYTATADLRSYFADDPAFAGNTVADGRATYSPWANLAVVGATGAIRRNGVALTTAAGAFHTQSSANPGCLIVSIVLRRFTPGTRATSTTLRNERFDTAIGTTAVPGVKRLNTMLTAHYDVSPSVTFYTELGLYYARSHAVQPPVINLNAITIPASNYWNPFGATLLPNGTANPNRLSGLTGVPAAGLPVTLTTYRYVDAGYQNVDVVNWQDRFLAGFRGKLLGFDFDTAALYSEARAIDRSDADNSTRLQQSLALSTPDAYNPFSGGCAATPSFGDCTPSSANSINAFTFKLRRADTTTLLLGDFKLSNANLFALPGGDLGLAIGVEGRHETQRDERDPQLNGSTPFVDAVTGATNLSNVSAVSYSPSTFGKRTVFSAFGELAVPVISPEMHVPLVRRIDLQIAGRYEHYSDFGSIAKPKIAGSWDVVDGIRFRGSYSKGFRAPNLEQVNTIQYSRLGANNDYYRCEALLREKAIATFNSCTSTASYSIQVAGNPNLGPENSTNWTAGTVLQPKFIPSRFGRLTLTGDFWTINQVGIVGQFGAQNAIVLDYLLRLQGSSNPNVVRAAATSDDTNAYAGSGLAPAGAILQIRDQFTNLLPQTVQGFDLSANWVLRTDRAGTFSVDLNGARLTKFSRQVPPSVQVLFDARAAGQINVATPLTDQSNLLEQNSRPKWRATGSLTWSSGGFQAGGFAQYIGPVNETDFLDANGVPYRVSGQTTFNLYTQYTFKDAAPWGTPSIRLGVRNLTDRQPPITGDGYLGALYNPYGRFLYVTIGTKF